jgi:uncharacterized glyoxalase superfamily protein PhnB
MGPGRRWIELAIPGAETGVVLFTPEGQEDRIRHLLQTASFACDDVRYSYDKLRERGVEFEEEPQKQPWGTYAIFKDPDGNRFVLGSK